MDLLAMFRRKPPEQVGDLGNAIDAQAHMSPALPAAMGELEWTGADYDTVATRPAPPSAARTWRQPSTGTPPTNAGVAFPDQTHTVADNAQSVGEPDTRRAEADRSSGPTPAFVPFAEDLNNVRESVVLDPHSPPDRPRQGFTGADPTRAAVFPLAFTIRPFDKGIADHPGAVTKAGQANPLAARPPSRTRLLGGRASPAGSTGSTMNPVGAAGPNTIRQAPPAWDTRVVNAGAQAPDVRAKSWRLT